MPATAHSASEQLDTASAPLLELRGIVRFTRQRDIPLFLIGRGSDLVISDDGIGGLVVLVRAAGVRVEGERVRVWTYEGGESFARRALATAEQAIDEGVQAHVPRQDTERVGRRVHFGASVLPRYLRDGQDDRKREGRDELVD